MDLNAIITSITASISSVGRKMSTGVSGIRNLSCTESGTRNTVSSRNFSIENSEKTISISAGGISHNRLIPLSELKITSTGKRRQKRRVDIIRRLLIL
jgi:hypothetical protein